ncbi:TPA: helix-turn-helix domain-containing protein [Streptococcus suis]|uniref:helix-turn-helix domain-containing protein n=1 Tax=Streptococcus suis TaxID=1307 RepID=UPI00040C3B08|nr:helix-turn-helix transcriptional regulator [Streptococcus suis]MDW8715001.1 helix-turn-helix transcriptional regulator [Streptococcus suis]MDX4992438.1 helix-turn-helix transcriptional regulator [Streptococcus suis]NQH00447.1 helix-turn-helix transcriptional regulator [Streptococcus suis]NQJ74591.1 helix-turn-helix transcriptional regulator [Streptococcus suis]NQJ78744.1 helix-turn-helix transcriptional regulator [Streptococcus suis]
MKNNFRVLLAKRRQSISEFAKISGISRSTLVSFYYERDVDIRLSTIVNIASHLDVTVDELIS